MASSDLAPQINTDVRSRHNSLPSNSVPFPITPVDEPSSSDHNHNRLQESRTGQGQSSEPTTHNHNVHYRINDYPATYPFTSPRHTSNPARISFSSTSPGASPSKRLLSTPGPRPSHSMTRAYSASSMRHRPVDQQLSPVAEEYDHPLHGWQARLLVHVPPAPRRSRTSLNPYPHSDPYHPNTRNSVHGQGDAGGTPFSSNGHIPTSVDSSADFHTNYAYDNHNHHHPHPHRHPHTHTHASPLPVDDLTVAMMLMMPSPTADRKRMAEKNRRAARTKKKRASRIGVVTSTGSGVKRVASAAGRAVGALRRALGARMRGR